ncbi:MAG: extracellular solute-binding protein [Mycobacteriales bacterium]
MTLTVWGQETTPQLRETLSRLDRQFEAAYRTSGRGVTVHRIAVPFDRLAGELADPPGGRVPDIVEVNQGYRGMGALVAAHRLRPLTKYAAAYGWTASIPAGLRAQNSVTDDGLGFGHGSLYGVSQNGDAVGLYYNKAKLAALHLSPASTWAQFEAQLPLIARAGAVPIDFGNRDGYPALYVYGVLQAELAGRDATRNLLFGARDAAGGQTAPPRWDTPANLEAAQALRSWERAGYLSPGSNGLTYEAAVNEFARGSGVYLITGTWESSRLSAAMGDNVGFMLPPPAAKGAPVVAPGRQGLAWTITSTSRNPDVAAAYLDFITGTTAVPGSPSAVDLMTKAGLLPVAGSGRKTARGRLISSVAQSWVRVKKADGIVPFVDFSTPTSYQPLSGGLREVIAGRATPAQFIARVQRDYTSFGAGG